MIEIFLCWIYLITKAEKYFVQAEDLMTQNPACNQRAAIVGWWWVYSCPFLFFRAIHVLGASENQEPNSSFSKVDMSLLVMEISVPKVLMKIYLHSDSVEMSWTYSSLILQMYFRCISTMKRSSNAEKFMIRDCLHTFYHGREFAGPFKHVNYWPVLTIEVITIVIMSIQLYSGHVYRRWKGYEKGPKIEKGVKDFGKRGLEKCEASKRVKEVASHINS